MTSNWLETFSYDNNLGQDNKHLLLKLLKTVKNWKKVRATTLLCCLKNVFISLLLLFFFFFFFRFRFDNAFILLCISYQYLSHTTLILLVRAVHPPLSQYWCFEIVCRSGEFYLYCAIYAFISTLYYHKHL